MFGADPVLTHDLDGRILSLNRAAEELLGLRKGRRRDLHLCEILAPQSRDVLAAYLARIARETTAGGLAGVQTTTGERRTVQYWATRREQPPGPVVRVVARDVTAEERAKGELRARARQQAAVASLGQGALTCVDLQALFDEAVAVLARNLRVEFAQVLELLPNGKALLLRAGVGWNEGLVGSATVRAGADSQAGYTLVSNQPVVVEDLRAEARFHGPPLPHQHDVVSGMSVVIPGRQRPFGVLGAHTRRARTFSPEDIHFLQAIANVLAAVIGRQRTEDDLRFLDEAGTILASSLDLETTLQGVVRLAVPYLADWCVVTVVDEQGVVRPVAAAHVDPAKEPLVRDLYARFPPNANAPAGPGPAVRGGRAVVIAEPSESWLQSPEVGAPKYSLYPELTPRSLMLVPLVARDRWVGTLAFASTVSGRRYSQVDGTLAGELARRAALAVDNARLYQEAREAIRREQAARAEIAALYDAIKQIAASLDLSTTLDSVLDVVVRVCEADNAVVALLDPCCQVIRFEAGRGPLAPIFQGCVVRLGEGALGWVAETGELINAPELADHPLCSDREAIVRAGIHSTLYVPLRTHGHILGVLAAFRQQPAPFGATSERILVALAGQAAIGIEHARLYREAGKVEALRELDRLKSELIATISHELRTPLSLIYGYAELLLQRELIGPTARAMVEEIFRGAGQLGQLVDDVIDTGEIERGDLRLEFQPVDLGRLVGEATAAAKVTATHRLAMDLPDRELVVRGDPWRLRQVVLNVLSNAMRYSPEGKMIGVQVGIDHGHATVSIADDGIGLAPDQIGRVFERFYRARSRVMHEQPGIGLGLPICRYIVEAHGGRIWAESPGLGQGSTFRFALPLVQSPHARGGEAC